MPVLLKVNECRRHSCDFVLQWQAVHLKRRIGRTLSPTRAPLPQVSGVPVQPTSAGPGLHLESRGPCIDIPARLTAGGNPPCTNASRRT